MVGVGAVMPPGLLCLQKKKSNLNCNTGWLIVLNQCHLVLKFFCVFLMNGVYKEVFKQPKGFLPFHSKLRDQMHQNKDFIPNLKSIFLFFFSVFIVSFLKSDGRVLFLFIYF